MKKEFGTQMMSFPKIKYLRGIFDFRSYGCLALK